MRPDIIEALQQLERGKRMSHSAVKEILETALVTAARKVLGYEPATGIEETPKAHGARQPSVPGEP